MMFLKNTKIVFFALVIFVIIGVIIFALSKLYHHYLDNSKNFVFILGNNRLHLLQNWIKEREAEFYFVANSEPFAESSAKLTYFFEESTRSKIERIVRQIMLNHNYENFMIFDSAFQKICDGNPFGVLNFPTTDFNHKIEKLKKFQRDTIYWDVKLRNDTAFLNSFCRVTLPNTGKTLWFYSSFKVNESLFPLIRLLDAPLSSYEFFLCKTEADTTINFASSQYTGLVKVPKFSISKDTLRPMVEAVRGYSGFVEGVDYWRNRVLAYVGQLKPLNVFFVSKVNYAEAMSMYYVHSFAGISIILICVLTLITYFEARRRKNKQITKERETQLLELALIEKSKYEQASKSAVDIILFCDLSGNILEANPKATDYFGLKEDKLVGKNISDFFFEKTPEKQSFSFDPERTRMVTKFINADGNYFWGEMSSSIVTSGSDHFVFCVIRDITELQHSLDKIKKLDRLLFTLSRINSIIIQNFELQGLFDILCSILVSEGKFEMVVFVRYFPEEAKLMVVANAGKHFTCCLKEVFSVDVCEISYPYIYYSLQNKEVYFLNHIAELPFSNQTDLINAGFASICCVPIKQKSTIFGIFVIFSSISSFFDLEELAILEELSRDVTFAIEKYFRDKEYYESEFKKRLFFDSSPIIYFVTSPEGIILEANRSAEEFLKVKIEEMIGKPISFFLPDGNKSIKDFLNESKMNKVSQNELILLNDNSIRKILLIAQFVREYDFILIIGNDVTEIRNYEEQLKKEKELAQISDKLKGYILQNISHEFRTPMSSILGFSKMLLNLSENSDVKEIAELIHNSANRLYNALEVLIYTSELETGIVRVYPENIQLYLFFEDLKQEFEPNFNIKGLKFQIECERSLEMRTDRKLLKMIIFVLLDNALKFTFEGEIRISARKKANFVRIEISDTGVGIPVKNREFIFDPFRQGSEGLTREFEGLGLGLFLAKKCTELLNGTIDFESEMGKGTTFFVTLPNLS